MGLLDWIFGEEQDAPKEGLEAAQLINQRASEIHAKKKGRKTVKVWQASVAQAKKELLKEGKIKLKENEKGR